MRYLVIPLVYLFSGRAHYVCVKEGGWRVFMWDIKSLEHILMGNAIFFIFFAPSKNLRFYYFPLLLILFFCKFVLELKDEVYCKFLHWCSCNLNLKF